VARNSSALKKQSVAAAHGVQFGELNNHLGYFVRRAQYWIFKDVNERLKKLRLNVVRYSVLEVIACNPGMSQKSLSSALGIESARLVALLDELQKRRLLLRQRSEQDRRSHELYLTPQGSTTLKEANKAVAAHEEWLLGHLDKEDYVRVLEALSKINPQ
jgi:DNA-binding MarR family transcriptional regulator